MKKTLFLVILFSFAAVLSQAQIFHCTVETKTGATPFSLRYIDYYDYRYILYIRETAFFLDERRLETLRDLLAKWFEWEAIASSEQAAVTKLIDVLEIDEYLYHDEFTKVPVTLYFVFSGTPPAFTLYVNVGAEVVPDFRFSKEQVEAFLDALTADHLDAARAEYDKQKRLEQLLN
ncbi:MAG: hypothetical protein LBB82_06635 [Treponema sp.]|jgi:hypothetical protein|nr:hypothetical protein [Treponema sp.]